MENDAVKEFRFVDDDELNIIEFEDPKNTDDDDIPQLRSTDPRFDDILNQLKQAIIEEDNRAKRSYLPLLQKYMKKFQGFTTEDDLISNFLLLNTVMLAYEGLSTVEEEEDAIDILKECGRLIEEEKRRAEKKMRERYER